MKDFSEADSGIIVSRDLARLVPALFDRSAPPMRCPAWGERFPEEAREVSITEFCQDYNECVASAILHLNDEHRWSRNQIADWLESLDADLEIG